METMDRQGHRQVIITHVEVTDACTVGQAAIAKDALEKAIAEAIELFTLTTGLLVHGVNLDYIPSMGTNYCFVLSTDTRLGMT